MIKTENMNIRVSELEYLQCLCLQHIDFIDNDQIVNLYQKLDDEAIFLESRKNGVTSILASVFMHLKIPNLPSHWEQEYKEVESKILEYMRQLDSAADLLYENGIKLIALKNSGITRFYYNKWGACPMGDLDVLVSKADFRQAHKILSENNYKLKFRSPLEEDSLEGAEQSGGAEYLFTLESGRELWFELQWRPVAGRWIQPSQEPDSQELLNDSLSFSNSKVRLLSPEDNLLQVALHTAKHSYVRSPGFRLHTDVDRVVRSTNIDWDVFIEKVRKYRLKTAVYFSLIFAVDFLRTPIPSNVLKELKPNSFKLRLIIKSLCRVGFFDPEGKKWKNREYILFVILLYDSFFDLLRGVVPTPSTLRSQYQINNSFLIPFFYIKRIYDLTLKRVLS